MATEWDLWDDDPWGEWNPGAREMARDRARQHMLGEHEDECWAEEDEELYIAALLVAGAEPEDCYHHEHQLWQERAASVLMAKYRRHWWYEWTIGGRVHADPRYRHKAATCRSNVQIDELTKFYTWVCKQRKEGWTNNLVPY